MGKSNNRLGITTRFNSRELEAVVSGMSVLGIKNIKDYVKFSSLKIADIVIRQQQEAANAAAQPITKGDTAEDNTTGDSGGQDTAQV